MKIDVEKEYKRLKKLKYSRGQLHEMANEIGTKYLKNYPNTFNTEVNKNPTIKAIVRLLKEDLKKTSKKRIRK